MSDLTPSDEHISWLPQSALCNISISQPPPVTSPRIIDEPCDLRNRIFLLDVFLHLGVISSSLFLRLPLSLLSGVRVDTLTDRQLHSPKTEDLLRAALKIDRARVRREEEYRSAGLDVQDEGEPSQFNQACSSHQ